MIRIRISESDLAKRVNEKGPQRRIEKGGDKIPWLEQAGLTREHNRLKKKFDQEAPSWSEIKEVYLEIQHGKCAFCERKLSEQQPDGTWRGKVEWDIEHFRPKNEVVSWPPAKSADVGIPAGIPLGEATDGGYYLLAHSPLNYLISCKTCNTESKGNYFPVAKPRHLDADDPRALFADERPYLIYPLGGDADSIDEDPEQLITFFALSPQPAAPKADVARYLRAIITIELFRLHTWELLLNERAGVISELYLALKAANDPASDEDARRAAKIRVDAVLSPKAPHSNCANAFQKLYVKDPKQAFEVYVLASSKQTIDVGDSEEAQRMKLQGQWSPALVDRLVGLVQRLRHRTPWF